MFKDAQLARNLACAKLRYVNEEDNEIIRDRKKRWLEVDQKLCMSEVTVLESE